MNHNFRLHPGITTHLEKIYGAPSFESWCDIKTKVKRGKKLGINYDPQSHMYLPGQQVKVSGFRNTANNYHGCWNKSILLKVVYSLKRKIQQKASPVHRTDMFNVCSACGSLCPARRTPPEGMSVCPVSEYLLGATHISIFSKKTIHRMNGFSNHSQSSSLFPVT